MQLSLDNLGLTPVSPVAPLTEAVRTVLSKFGSDAHLYTFGPGVPILGPELVVNGDFSNGTTGWGISAVTIDASSGKCIVTPSSQFGSCTQELTTVVGRRYRLTCTGRLLTSAAAYIKVRTLYGNLGTQNLTAITSPVVIDFTATETLTIIEPQSLSAGLGTFEVDDISVKEILGYSNTYSGFVAGNYFDSAGTTHASVDGSVGLVLDAAGSVGADRITTTVGIAATLSSGNLTENTANTNHGVAFVNTTTAKRSEFRFRLKAGTKSWAWVYFEGYTGGSAWFNLAAGTVGTSESGVAGTIKPAGDGYYDCTLIKINPTAAGSCNIFAVSGDNTTAGYLGTGSVALQIASYSVHEITGIHASQGTPGFKPTLRKGIVNWLRHSSDFTNAVWLKRGTLAVTPNYAQGLSRIAGIDIQTVGDMYQQQNGEYPSAYGVGIEMAQDPACTSGVIALSNPAQDNNGRWEIDLALLPTTKTLITKDHPCVTVTTPFSGLNNSGGLFIRKASGAGKLSVLVGNCGTFPASGTLTAAQIIAAGGIPLTTTAPASSVAGLNHLEFVDTNSQCLIRPPASVGASGWAVIAIAASKRAFMCPMGSLGTSNEVGQAGYAFKLRTDGAVWLRIGDGSGNPGNISETLTPANAYQIGIPIVLSMRWVSGGNFVGRVNGVDVGSVACINPSGTNGGVSIGRHGAIGAEFFAGKIFFAQDGVGAMSEQDIAMIEKQAAAAAGIQL